MGKATGGESDFVLLCKLPLREGGTMGDFIIPGDINWGYLGSIDACYFCFKGAGLSSVRALFWPPITLEGGFIN